MHIDFSSVAKRTEYPIEETNIPIIFNFLNLLEKKKRLFQTETVFEKFV